MPNSNDKYSLRQEARPIPYWKHHKRAKEALDFIIDGLAAALKSVGIGKRDDKHSVDTSRTSRIIFVSGEPGSGKSSLYLTLKETLSSPRDNEFRRGIRVHSGVEKVRWLDALDLEVASEEGENLLAAVLVRIINELTTKVSNTLHSQPCDDAIKKLEELATDIGIAWEGNLRARGGALDPDTYSEEVMRTQRARLGINDRLREALDELAENSCYGCDDKTLFVLPVDDLYLKPDVSLQLLRLLRMISIPRLFFLIMGDITTVEALFIEKSLADWTEVAGARLFASRPERLDDAITRARELRARYLRKLLPPLQRTMLEPMDWHEALDFETGRPDDADDTIEELLASVKLDRPFEDESETNVTLLDFLISPPLSNKGEEKDKKEDRAKQREKRHKRAKGEDLEDESKEERYLKDVRSAYTALQILDATPREMMDLGAALREVLRKAKDKRSVNDNTPLLLTTVCWDIVNLVRDEQNFLNEKAQRVLEGVLPTRHYGYPEDIVFEMHRLSLYPSPRPWNPRPWNPADGIWFREHRSWNLTITEKPLNDSKGHREQDEDKYHDENGCIEQAAKDPYAKLPPRPAAWYVLLHDLAWTWRRDSVGESLVEKLCKYLNEWNLLDKGVQSPPTSSSSNRRFIISPQPEPNPSDCFVGWAVYSPNGVNYKHFSIPSFQTVRDLDRFLFIWTKGLAVLSEDIKVRPKLLFDLWELAGRAMFLDKSKTRKEDVDFNVYKDFAEGGTNWYEGLQERIDDFEEKQTKIASSPPNEDEVELRDWLSKLEVQRSEVENSLGSQPSSPPEG